MSGHWSQNIFKTHFILQQFIFSMLKDYQPDMIFHSMTLKVHTISHKVYTATPKRVKKGTSREMLWWKQAYAAIFTGFLIFAGENSKVFRKSLFSSQHFPVRSPFSTLFGIGVYVKWHLWSKNASGLFISPCKKSCTSHLAWPEHIYNPITAMGFSAMFTF